MIETEIQKTCGAVVRSSDWLGRVLVACEYSGIVRDAFTRYGWDAWSCDILPTESNGNHIQDDVLNHLDEGWDIMVAHPPCTHLSVAGAPSFAAKKEDGRQSAALDFVRKLMAAPIEHIAIENPISIISSHIRQPDQIIQPWHFGDPYLKKTCLWLKNLPPLQYAVEDELFGKKTAVEPQFKLFKSKKNKSGYSKYPLAWSGKRDWKLRAKFWLGIAEAMANQWTLATRPNHVCTLS